MIVGPPEIAVIIHCEHVPWDPHSLSQRGNREDVRISFRAAGIIGGNLALSTPFSDDFCRHRRPEGHAIIIQIGFYFRMPFSGQRNLEIRLRGKNHIKSRLHCFSRALIHRNHGLIKPPLFAKMLGKIRNEAHPINLIVIA